MDIRSFFNKKKDEGKEAQARLEEVEVEAVAADESGRESAAASFTSSGW